MSVVTSSNNVLPMKTDCSLQDQVQRDDLIVQRAARGRLALLLGRRLDPMGALVLRLAGAVCRGTAH
jgi:hypothetical protein